MRRDVKNLDTNIQQGMKYSCTSRKIHSAPTITARTQQSLGLELITSIWPYCVRSLTSSSYSWSTTSAMYPSLGNFGGMNMNKDSGSQGRGRPENPGPPGWPPSQLGSTPNGPNPPPPAASNLPLLRVQIADHLRTSPPVSPHSVPSSRS
jgi:hypothetical protein